ncbi:MAG: 3-methyl-2-oxobutanoate hydroxymethyltransferase, partial [Cohaesibacteraceae bacterium]|nr:3-methyl-2-oxobutanoate hydroxymethyltransferase [Cohaesibacteraceae bacterium]
NDGKVDFIKVVTEQTGDDFLFILQDAIRLQDAGASMLVVECVPASLGARLASELTIPVIGIGAGPDTDAQVLVMHDMLGLGDGPKPRFVKDFLENAGSVRAAFSAFRRDVESGVYPAPEHSYRPGTPT